MILMITGFAYYSLTFKILSISKTEFDFTPLEVEFSKILPEIIQIAYISRFYLNLSNN